MPAVLAEVGGEQGRINLELNYADLSSSVHNVIDNITLRGMGFFGEGNFRVDNIEEDTLEIARSVLQASVGEQLPRFYVDESGDRKELGSTPVVEERHARFMQQGELFEGWNGNLSAMLRIPAGVEKSAKDLEEPHPEPLFISRREQAAIYAMSVLPQLPGYGGLTVSMQNGDWRPGALGVLMSAGLSKVALLGAREIGEHRHSS